MFRSAEIFLYHNSNAAQYARVRAYIGNDRVFETFYASVRADERRTEKCYGIGYLSSL